MTTLQVFMNFFYDFSGLKNFYIKFNAFPLLCDIQKHLAFDFKLIEIKRNWPMTSFLLQKPRTLRAVAM